MTDTEKLEQVMALFEKSALASMDVELEGLKVRLKKGTDSKISKTQETSKPERKKEPQEKEQEDENLQKVLSPLVGIFYASSKENGDPFVHIGDKVKKGDVLCLIEAMKTMNEITSEYDGILENILIENGSMAQFDQPLFEIRKE